MTTVGRDWRRSWIPSPAVEATGARPLLGLAIAALLLLTVGAAVYAAASGTRARGGSDAALLRAAADLREAEPGLFAAFRPLDASERAHGPASVERGALRIVRPGGLVLSQRPWIEWTLLPGASTYALRIQDENGDTVADETSSTTPFRFSVELVRGAHYVVEVGTEGPFGPVTARRAYRVATTEEAVTFEAQREAVDRIGGPEIRQLLLAHVYLRQDLLVEAELALALHLYAFPRRHSRRRDAGPRSPSSRHPGRLTALPRVALGLILLLAVPVAGAEEAPADAREAAASFREAHQRGDESAMRALLENPELGKWSLVSELVAAGDLPAAGTAAALGSEFPGGQGLAAFAARWLPSLTPEDVEREGSLCRLLAEAQEATTKRNPTRALALIERDASWKTAKVSLGALRIRTVRANALARRNRWVEAEAELASLEEDGDRIGWQVLVVISLSFHGYCALQQARFDEGRSQVMKARSILDTLGLAADVADMDYNLARIELRAGRPEAAARHAHDAYVAYVQLEKDDRVPDALFRKSVALMAAGSPQNALDTMRQARALYKAMGRDRRATDALSNLGIMQAEVARYAEALASFEGALATYEGLGAEVPAIRVLLNLGGVYQMLGLTKEGNAYLEEARTRAERAGRPDLGLRAEQTLSVGLVHDGKKREAMVLLESLARRLEVAGRKQECGIVLSNYASLRLETGDWELVEQSATHALEMHQARGDERSSALALAMLARVAGERGDGEAAARLAARALALVDGLPDQSPTDAATLEHLALVERRAKHHARAVDLLRRAIEIDAEGMRGLGEVQALGLRRYSAHFTDHGIESALAWAATTPAQERKQHGGSLLSRIRPRPAPGRGPAVAPPDPGGCVAGRAAGPRCPHARSGERNANAPAGGRPGVPGRCRGDPAGPTSAGGRVGGEAALRRATPARGAPGSEPGPSPGRGVAEVREALTPDTALILYHLGEQAAAALVITTEGTHLVRLAETEDLNTTAQAYLHLASAAGGREERLARRLYERLIAPLEAHLAGRTRLLISPNGLLAWVPFCALLSDHGDKATRLVERFETAFIPSATVYAHSAVEQRGAAAGKGLLALGDPAYPAAQTAGSPKLLEPLPASRAEVEAVRGFFPDGHEALLGEEATVANLRRALGRPNTRWRAVHLACHAFLDPKRVELSGLALAGGEMLDLDAVYRMSVPADLVVLSACETGRSRLARGEGAIGLVRGFFFAGAPRVLATTWRVEDTGTRVFMERFYEHWIGQGLAPAAALRRAQLDLLEADGEHAHPYYWAPFVLWGLPR